MPRHPVGFDIGNMGRIASVVLCLLAGRLVANDVVPDVDPAGVADPVERRFYQELRELRDRQKRQRQELVNQDLSPEVRLEKRRALLIQSHKDLQKLETDYQSKLSPEARTRWMERKANRQKRFDKLRQQSEQDAEVAPDPNKASRKKSR